MTNAIENSIGVSNVIDPRHIVEDRLAGVVREIEVGVVRHVEDGVLVGGGCVLHLQRGIAVDLGECVTDGDVQRAGKSHVAIGRDEREFDAVANHLRAPDLGVEAVRAAMQSEGGLVQRNLIGLAVERELPAIDAVGVAADGRAHPRGHGGLVVLELVVSQDHAAHDAVAVGHSETDEARAVCDDFDFGFGGGECVNLDGRARGVLIPEGVGHGGGMDARKQAKAGSDKYRKIFQEISTRKENGKNWNQRSVAV